MEKLLAQESEVLVVEDNAVDAIFIKKALKNSRITENVTVVTDGKLALEYMLDGARTERLSEAMPKLIILDLMMPHMNGFEFLHNLRSYPKFKDVPVVIFSGSNDEHDKKMALDLGADSYFTKPLSIHAFVAIIEEVGKFWLQTDTAH